MGSTCVFYVSCLICWVLKQSPARRVQTWVFHRATGGRSARPRRWSLILRARAIVRPAGLLEANGEGRGSPCVVEVFFFRRLVVQVARVEGLPVVESLSVSPEAAPPPHARVAPLLAGTAALAATLPQPPLVLCAHGGNRVAREGDCPEALILFHPHPDERIPGETPQ